MKVLFKEFDFTHGKHRKISAVHAYKVYGKRLLLGTQKDGVITWWRTNGREWVKVND